MSGDYNFQGLRKKAELLFKNLEGINEKAGLYEEMSHLIEDLSAHQIEIEKQNDALYRSQQALVSQKNKYLELYENAPVAYLTIDSAGNIITQNLKARKFFGDSGKNSRYISIFPFIDNLSENNFRKMLDNSFLNKKEQHGEIRMIASNKSAVYTDVHMAIYHDAELEQDLCRVTITNIENIKNQFNQQLQKSEEKYCELSENISEGIYLTENGYIKMANTPACRLFGFESHEMIDRKVWEFVKKDQQEEVRALFHQKFIDQDGSPVDIECVRKDGTTFWAEISMRIIIDERRVFGVISDISSRKEAERALRNSEQRLQMALKGTNAGLWDWNISSGNLIFDKNWAKMLGFNLDEIETHISSWKKLIHPEDLIISENKMSEHLKGLSEFYQSTHRVMAKNGEWKYILESGMVIERDANGIPLRAVGTHQDMTYQKQTEEKLREINTTKDKLFSIIAHDLKSPYNAQLGFLELLIEDEDSYTPEQRKKFISTVYQSTKQSFSLLDNLLMWSRTQTGKIPFNPSELLIAQLFEDAIDIQKHGAEAKNITIDTDIPNENLEVTADYEMVSTILRNLISNSIKFTHEKGEIVLGAKAVSDNKILISVSDTGVGIPEEDIHKLFDAANNYTTIGTNREKGTGIGLIICKDFVERNDGKIWVESKLGQGTTFFFTLDSLKKSKKCGENCIQNFKEINNQIKQNEELHQYFLKTIIPFFRHTYQKFSEEEINCFIDELQRLSEKHQIIEFTTFTETIQKSLKSKDKNQINICFAEFERLTDNLEIAATRKENLI